ncbi:MAG: DMT family transporter [Candidatus Dormibacteria bacterium]
MSRRAWLLFTAMGVIWGIPYLLIKISVGVLSPPTLVFCRTAIGGLLLLPLALAHGDIRPVLRRWRWMLVYTVVELAVPWLLLSEAETQLSSSLSGLLVAAVPLVGAAIATVLRSDDRLDSRRGLGLVVGFAGVGALVGLDLSHTSLVAFLEVGVVVVGYALGPVIISRRLDGVPATGVAATSLALTALIYAPPGLTHLPATWPPLGVVLSVLALGAVCTALAFVLFFALIAAVGPIRATVITYVNPAVALILGVVVLGERLTLGAGAGFVLVLTGMILATRRPTSPAQDRTEVSAMITAMASSNAPPGDLQADRAP